MITVEKQGQGRQPFGGHAGTVRSQVSSQRLAR